jgi:hypothetical protein
MDAAMHTMRCAETIRCAELGIHINNPAISKTDLRLPFSSKGILNTPVANPKTGRPMQRQNMN